MQRRDFAIDFTDAKSRAIEPSLLPVDGLTDEIGLLRTDLVENPYGVLPEHAEDENRDAIEERQENNDRRPPWDARSNDHAPNEYVRAEDQAKACHDKSEVGDEPERPTRIDEENPQNQ